METLTESPAVEQLKALSQLCNALSYEGQPLDGDHLLFAIDGISNALAAEWEQPQADVGKIAEVAGAATTLLRFASESPAYRTGSGGNNEGDELNDDQRKALASCASLAETAAKLCRESVSAQ